MCQRWEGLKETYFCKHFLQSNIFIHYYTLILRQVFLILKHFISPYMTMFEIKFDMMMSL